MKTKQLLVLGLFLFSGSVMMGQDQPKDRVINISYTPQLWDNVSFALCYSNEDVVYNVGSHMICKPGKLYELNVSPACNSFATLYLRGKKKNASIYSYIDGSLIRNLKLREEPTAI